MHSRRAIASLALGVVVLLVPAAAAALDARSGGPAANDDEVLRLGRLLGVANFPSADEARLWADAAAGRLDKRSLLRSALVAGGVVDETVLGRYLRQFQRWTAELRAVERPDDPPRRRADAILQLMHRRIFTGGYQADATELARVFERGEFNCASGTILYLCLAREIGLKAVAVELPAHAFCRIEASGEAFDVETTCPTWFQVAGDPAVRAALLLRALGPAQCAPEARRIVSTSQLLAVIYYNRGVKLLESGEYGDAISANLGALRLDPLSDPARRNLWAAVNNRALALCRAGHFAEAADLVARARRAVPDHVALKANEIYIRQQWNADLSHKRPLAPE